MKKLTSLLKRFWKGASSVLLVFFAWAILAFQWAGVHPALHEWFHGEELHHSCEDHHDPSGKENSGSEHPGSPEDHGEEHFCAITLFQTGFNYLAVDISIERAKVSRLIPFKESILAPDLPAIPGKRARAPPGGSASTLFVP